VLEGEVRFKLGDEIQTGPTGSYVFIPRATPHAWQNVGDGPARMLFHFTPSGMDPASLALRATGSTLATRQRALACASMQPFGRRHSAALA
jgi:oxalate decarboxylase/phosphoglucose isomerase-like protein (cupin superfamily)